MGELNQNLKIKVEEQRFIPETSYLFLKGVVQGLNSDASLCIVHNGKAIAETSVVVANDGRAQWQFEKLSPQKIESSAIHLAVFIGKLVVCEQDLTLRADAELQEAIKALRRKHVVNVFGVDDSTRTDNKTALAALQQTDFPVVLEQLKSEDLQSWMEEVDYAGNYPGYTKEFPLGGLLEAKAAQHYISILLTSPDEDTVLMDTASSASPFWKIVERLYGAEASYRQDLNFPAGVHGFTVGSNVANIPFPDASLNMITSHCSWEHFEGNTDVQYVAECDRLLRPGGALIIVPLYFADQYAVHTSPHIWNKKYAAANEPPEFDGNVTIFLREGIRQRAAKFYTGPELIRKILKPFAEQFIFFMHYYENHHEISGCPAFALRGVKRA